MKHDPVRTLVFRLTSVTLAVLLTLSILAMGSALNSFERVLLPELRLKAVAVADVLSRQIDRALNYDIPLDQLPGLSEAIKLEVAHHADIAYASIEDLSGRALAAFGQPPNAPSDDDIVISLDSQGKKVATLRLSIDPAYSAKVTLDLMLEIASEMLVSVLIAFEVLLLVVHLSMAKINALRHAVQLAEAGDFRGRILPMSGLLGPVAAACQAMLDSVNRRFSGDAGKMPDAVRTSWRFRAGGEAPLASPVNLVYLRLPVFLFCLSEELSRPFMPAYAQSLAPTAPWLSPDLAVSLPITLFMTVWALSQPFGPRLSQKVGRWQAFAGSAALAALGLAMTAITDSLLGLLLWRCVTALGYGVVLITAQGIVVDHTTATNRASGLALFIGALLAAGVCGPIVGGIVADQAGASATLLVGAGTALLAAALLIRLFGRSPPSSFTSSTISAAPPAAPVTLSSASAWILLRNKRFAALMALSAIPAKIAATGILFCLIPLLLVESGASKAEVGRVQMMYFLVFMLASPLAANFSDRWHIRRGFIVAGGLATLLSVLPIAMPMADWGATLAIGLFGAAQALIGAPQLTLITQIAAHVKVPEIDAIGWYRLLERLGGAVGPLLAMALAALWSYRDALLGIGILCGVSAIVFWWLFRNLPPAPAVSEKHT